jgi:tripartite-type tricarboxylate transporter receptor subunit TctC
MLIHYANRILCPIFLSSLLVALTVAGGTAPATAQPAEAFYKGKQMRFIIRSAPGGGYDLYGRLVGRHIVNHIPGKPTIIPQNMPGGGGITAANYMAEVAPRDGTYLTMIGQALPLDYALGFTPSFKADLRSFNWIGNISDSNMLTYTWHASPIKTMEDAKKRETLIAATGAGDLSSWIPAVYNNVLGTKFKVIDGYKSVGEVRLAMERGEIEGYGANPLSAVLSVQPNALKDNIYSIFVQVGLKRDPQIPNVPLLSELTDDPEKKAVLEFISKGLAVGRPIGTTPGVPADRVAVLRKAFDSMLVDPQFIADAQKQAAEIGPMDGETVAQLIDTVLSAPQELKDKAKATMPPR